MTSSFGYDTAYSAIADYYLNLAPNCNDTVFGTDINYCKLVKSGIVDGMENDPQVLSAYSQLNNTAKKSLLESFNTIEVNTPLAAKNVKLRNFLREVPQLSIFADLVDKTGWSQVLYSTDKITVFAPTNQSLQVATSTWLTNTHVGVVRDVLKAHTLPYKLEYEDVHNRLLKLNTFKESFAFFFDDTGRHTPYASLYTPRYALKGYNMPAPEPRIPVIKTYEVEDAVTVYIIDGVFKPLSK